MVTMDEKDVKRIVNDEIDKFVKDALDKEIRKLLSKPNSQTRQGVVAIFKDAMEAVFKTLWQKRDFWKTDIK